MWYNRMGAWRSGGEAGGCSHLSPSGKRWDDSTHVVSGLNELVCALGHTVGPL